MDKPKTSYRNNPDVPDETLIRFSRWKQAFNIFLALLIMGAGGLWVFFPKDDPGSLSSIWSYVLGILFICFGGGFFWIASRDFLNRDVQLIIGDRGIKRLGGDLYTWDKIQDEKIVKKGSGRSTSFHLIYTCPRGLVDVTLSGLDIGRTRLLSLLQVYRKRSKTF